MVDSPTWTVHDCTPNPVLSAGSVFCDKVGLTGLMVNLEMGKPTRVPPDMLADFAEHIAG